MKGFAGFLFILAIGMVLNAVEGKWAFDRAQSGSIWVVLDLAIAAAFLIGSYLLWSTAKYRELVRYVDESERKAHEEGPQ